jgi:serine/threonine protein kinase
MSTDPRIGTELAGYRIESLIGRGGMSVVYLAEQEFPKRKVALKVLSSDLAQDAKFRERFVRESNIAASIEHPNIVPIYGAGQSEGLLYIAMRYIGGGDLKALIHSEGQLPTERAMSIISQVAGALDAAHAAGLVHRDVKPSNILLGVRPGPTAPDHAYLSDFGLTKRVLSDSGITGTGVFVGTLDYAAPEQFEGKTLDGRTDVYSLGCVLYECLTGELPYPRDQDAALMYAHLLSAPPSVTD